MASLQDLDPAVNRKHYTLPLDRVYLALNCFERNLQFTVDTFENQPPHFLDTEIAPNGFPCHAKIPTQDYPQISIAINHDPIVKPEY